MRTSTFIHAHIHPAPSTCDGSLVSKKLPSEFETPWKWIPRALPARKATEALTANALSSGQRAAGRVKNNQILSQVQCCMLFGQQQIIRTVSF